MSKRKKRRGPRRRYAKHQIQMLAAQKLNSLYQRTRKQGEKIPVHSDPIEPDRGEKL